MYLVSPDTAILRISVEFEDHTPEARVFRWHDGDLQRLIPPEGAEYNLSRHDSNGNFLAFRQLSTFSREYWITDGFVHGPAVLLDRTAGNGAQAFEVLGITADGSFLVNERFQTDDFNRTQRVFFVGTRTDVLATSLEVFDPNTETVSGSLVQAVAVNSLGDVVTYRHTFDPAAPTRQEVKLHRANGESEVVAQQGAVYSNIVQGSFNSFVTSSGEVIFNAELTGVEGPSRFGAFTGPSGEADRFGIHFDPAFGGTGIAHSPTYFASHEDGPILVFASIDGAQSIPALAVREPSEDSNTLQWSNPSGGSFTTANNWSPARTPEHSPERSDTVVFALGGQYPVNASGAQAGRMIVRNGIVDITGNTQLFGDSLTEPSLLVGNNGILNVVSGFFNSANAAIGESSAAPGEVAVLNNGTRWESNGRLLVGDGGPGKLSVVNGFASALETRIGGGALAGGDVVVGGATGRLETGSVAVGFGGPGQLEIRDGGTVVSTDAEIGRVLTGPHTVEVYSQAKSGTPSLWSVLEGLAVAVGGPGSLTIREGGEVAAGFVLIGNVGEGAGLGAGEIIVEGASVGGHRALLDVLGGSFLIGNGAPADLFVRAGGLVRSEGNIVIGFDTPGRAAVEGRIGEDESSVPSAIETTEGLTVGLEAEGTLRIAEGGRVAASELLAGSSSSSSADIVVDGGFLSIEGNGRVGGGDSKLLLKNGGLAFFKEGLDLGVTAGGKTAVSVFDDSNLLVESDIALGQSGESILEAVDGALVFARDLVSRKESGDYPVRATFRGRTPGGQPSALDVDNITWFAGELEFLDGGQGGVEGLGMDFGYHGSSALLISGSGGGEPSRLRVKGEALFGVGEGASTVIEIVNGGLLDVVGPLYMGLFSGGLAVVTGEGSLVRSGGVFETGGPGFYLLVDAGGTLETGAVTLDSQVASLVQLTHPTAGTAWTVNGGMQVGAGAGTGTTDLVLCGASILTSDTVLIGPRGTLNTFFGIVNAPAVRVQGLMTYQCTPPNAPPAPPASKSDSPGNLTVTGDLILEPGARMEMRVFGAGPGESDLLEVMGNFTAGGTLNILFEGGYSPTTGDAFDLIATGGNVFGAFSAIRFPNLQPGFEFDAELTSEGFVLTALNDGVLETPVPVGIFGHIVSGSTQDPLPCSVATLNTSTGVFIVTAVADLNGRYFFEPQEPGEYSIVVYSPGFAPLGAPIFTIGEEGEPVEFDFPLTPIPVANDYSGRVTDSVTGEPLVGVMVEVLQGDELRTRTFTCADGRYTMLAQGQNLRALYTLENYAVANITEGVAAATIRDVSLDPLVPGTETLTGLIRGATMDEPIVLDDARITVRGPINVSTESGLDGAYILDNLLAGSYSVTASAPGYGGQSVQRILGEAPGIADFLLQPLATIEEPVTPGDINGDGVVNAVDVQLVINAALGIAIEQGFNPDINGDGLVNAVDVQLVINAALGLSI